MRSLAPLLALAPLAACAALAPPPILPAEPGFDGFPAHLRSGPLEVSTAFASDHAARLGVDLVRLQRVLPVRLELASRAAAGAPTLRLVEARLYLTDGTVLVATGRGAVELERAGAAALVPDRPGSELDPGGLLAGTLLFDLGPDLRVERHFALTARDGVYREVDLLEALVALRLESEAGGDELHVGLTPASAEVARR